MGTKTKNFSLPVIITTVITHKSVEGYQMWRLETRFRQVMDAYCMGYDSFSRRHVLDLSRDLLSIVGPSTDWQRVPAVGQGVNYN